MGWYSQGNCSGPELIDVIEEIDSSLLMLVLVLCWC
jgi:hypothetical protein